MAMAGTGQITLQVATFSFIPCMLMLTADSQQQASIAHTSSHSKLINNIII